MYHYWTHIKTLNFKRLGILTFLIALIGSFQNCGEGFKGSSANIASRNCDLDKSCENTPPEITGGPAVTRDYCPFDAAGLAPNNFNGRPVVRVCPNGDSRTGCDTNSLKEAIETMAQNGSRVEVVAGKAIYTECAVVGSQMKDLEIIGICGKPHMSGPACASKGFIHNNGTRTTVANLEISGINITMSEGGNGAAIRDQGVDLTVKDVYFHDNQNGILGGEGTVTISWSKFESNGSDQSNNGGEGFAHNIYMSNSVDQLLIDHSIFLRARFQGNNLKSRAKYTRFECSVSASLDGVDSRELDIPDGGRLEILNSIIQQGPQSSNKNLIGFATESQSNPNHYILIQDSWLINDLNSNAASFIAYKTKSDSLPLILNNLSVVGPGNFLQASTKGGYKASLSITQTGLIFSADRTEAQLGSYSTDYKQLPKPPGCDSFEYF